jgi:hypothetical protein
VVIACVGCGGELFKFVVGERKVGGNVVGGVMVCGKFHRDILGMPTLGVALHL